MDSSADGYVTEIPYVNRFYQELTPELLRFALLAKGFRPPRFPLVYCELGSGHGLSTNVNAAANPESQFFGVDYISEHTSVARGVSAAAGTRNVTFYDDSFERFSRRELPQFDLICLHGVYTWVSAENRQRLIDLIAAKLRPGGAVYLSYNCLPGWAPIAPIRELFWRHHATSEGPLVERIEAALDFVSRLQQTQTGYFSNNRNVERSLKAIHSQDRNVLAHEYFARDWKPMYFSQVASDLAGAELTFAAPVSIIDQFDAATLDPPAQQQLERITDPVLHETVLDFLVNRIFRRDIFVRGSDRLSDGQKTEYLLDQRFALMIPRADWKPKHQLQRGDVELQANVHEPLADALAERPMTLRELMLKPQIEGISSGALIQAAMIAVGIGFVQPALPEAGQEQRKVSTDRFNRAACAAVHDPQEQLVLASPVTGGGVRVNRFEAMYLAAESADEDPVTYAWTILKRRNERLTQGGEGLQGDADNLRSIQSSHNEFVARRRPVLQRLGIR